MDKKTLGGLLRELSDVCKKYNVVIGCTATAADDTNLSCCIEICELIKVKGRWPQYKTIFECDEIS